MKKKELVKKLRYYYTQDKILEEDKQILSAKDWLHGYVFALLDNNVLTYEETENLLEEVKKDVNSK